MSDNLDVQWLNMPTDICIRSHKKDKSCYVYILKQQRDISLTLVLYDFLDHCKFNEDMDVKIDNS